MTKRKAEF